MNQPQSVTHVAGAVVTLAGRVIQRCAVCGEKLVDSKNTMSIDGAPMPTWAEAALVSVCGHGSAFVGEYMDETKALPLDFCISLVED